jgi:hypothetical protein
MGTPFNPMGYTPQNNWAFPAGPAYAPAPVVTPMLYPTPQNGGFRMPYYTPVFSAAPAVIQPTGLPTASINLPSPYAGGSSLTLSPPQDLAPNIFKAPVPQQQTAFMMPNGSVYNNANINNTHPGAALPVQQPPSNPMPALTSLDNSKKPAVPEEDKPDKKGEDVSAKAAPSSPLLGEALGLNEDTIKGLYQELQNPDVHQRGETSVKLAKILDTNPDCFKDPQYKSYVEALVLKVLRDSSPEVHTPVLVSLQTSVNKPTQGIINQLATMKNRPGEVVAIEPSLIDSMFNKWRSVQEAEQAKLKAQQQASTQNLVAANQTLPSSSNTNTLPATYPIAVQTR